MNRYEHNVVLITIMKKSRKIKFVVRMVAGMYMQMHFT